MSGPSTGHARPGLLGSIRHDIGRKLTALGLGVLTWLIVDSQVVDERTFWLDIEVSSERGLRDDEAFYLVVPPTLVLEKSSHQRVEVRVRGLREELEDLRISRVLRLSLDDLEGAPRQTVDLALDEGRSEFLVEPADATLSKFSVHPRTLTLTLARRISRNVPLASANATVVGAPREGYVFDMSRVDVVPNEVSVSGPQDLVDAVVADPAMLRLEPVDVRDKLARVIAQVGLDREHVDPRLVMETIDGVVQVNVPIVPEPEAMELLGVAVSYQNTEALEASGRKLLQTSPSLDLRVEGPRPWLAAQDAQELRDRIHLLVDWAEVGSLPRGFHDVRVLREDIPDTVRITNMQGDRPQIEYSLEEIGETDP